MKAMTEMMETENKIAGQPAADPAAGGKTKAAEGPMYGVPAGAAHVINESGILKFTALLSERERSEATIDKYVRDVRGFSRWAGAGASVDKEKVKAYKQYLRGRYKLASANSMLCALNTFFKSMGWDECRISTFKVQRAAFRSDRKDLTRAEYLRLLQAAESRGKSGKSNRSSGNGTSGGNGSGRGARGAQQIGLIMETLAGTGIRISELPFITVAALDTRRAIVSLKGKTREVLLHKTLCRKLRAYCRERGVTAGSIFVTRTGRPVDRSNILRRMKALSEAAGVLREKIFPHNLRHLFAVTYYEKEKDIAHLADILGHSNINTTRIYTMINYRTQLEILDRIGSLLGGVG